MRKIINIEDLKKVKSEFLTKLKEIKYDKTKEEYRFLKNEYIRAQNKIRYYTDEEHRKTKSDNNNLYYHNKKNISF